MHKITDTKSPRTQTHSHTYFDSYIQMTDYEYIWPSSLQTNTKKKLNQDKGRFIGKSSLLILLACVLVQIKLDGPKNTGTRNQYSEMFLCAKSASNVTDYTRPKVEENKKQKQTMTKGPLNECSNVTAINVKRPSRKFASQQAQQLN